MIKHARRARLLKLTAEADWRLVTRLSADNLLPEDEMKPNF